MLLSPLLQLLLTQLLPCSCNTDSAFLPARNEDREHPLRPNPINFCKRAGENFLSNLRHQHHWARPADSDGGHSTIPTSASSHAWRLSLSHISFTWPAALILHSRGQSVNSSNNLPAFHSWAHPGFATAQKLLKLSLHHLPVHQTQWVWERVG